jgi:hypothetical protein
MIIEHEASAQAPTVEQGDIRRTREDRRLLLGASLRLLGHRFSCGKPILQDDVVRVASLADDAFATVTTS